MYIRTGCSPVKARGTAPMRPKVERAGRARRTLLWAHSIVAGGASYASRVRDWVTPPERSWALR
jgi:hypothetical protein